MPNMGCKHWWEGYWKPDLTHEQWNISNNSPIDWWTTSTVPSFLIVQRPATMKQCKTKLFRKQKHSPVARWVSRESKLWFRGPCVDQCWFGIWLNEWYPYSTSTNGVKEHTRGHQGCNTNQILVLGGNLTTRESLYARVSIGVGITLNHIGTRVILSRYEGSCMLYRPEWYPKKKKTFHIPISCGYQKLWNPHYRYPNGTKRRRYWTNIGLVDMSHMVSYHPLLAMKYNFDT